MWKASAHLSTFWYTSYHFPHSVQVPVLHPTVLCVPHSEPTVWYFCIWPRQHFIHFGMHYQYWLCTMFQLMCFYCCFIYGNTRIDHKLLYSVSFLLSVLSDLCTVLLGCTNPGHQVTWMTEFCMVLPKTYGSLVCKLLNVTLLAPRILRWVLDLWTPLLIKELAASYYTWEFWCCFICTIFWTLNDFWVGT